MNLPVLPQSQEDPLWCWAAIGSMVSNFYAIERNMGTPMTQCQVASLTLARPCCPSPPPPPNCRIQQNLQKTLLMIGHGSNRPAQPPSFAVVATEIQNGRPLCFAFQYNQGALHYLLINGCDPQDGQITLIDPASGIASSGPFSNLVQNNAGNWAGWIFTQ